MNDVNFCCKFMLSWLQLVLISAACLYANDECRFLLQVSAQLVIASTDFCFKDMFRLLPLVLISAASFCSVGYS